MRAGLPICRLPAGWLLKHVSPRGCERWSWVGWSTGLPSGRRGILRSRGLTDVLLTAAGREFASRSLAVSGDILVAVA